MFDVGLLEDNKMYLSALLLGDKLITTTLLLSDDNCCKTAQIPIF